MRKEHTIKLSKENAEKKFWSSQREISEKVQKVAGPNKEE